MLNLEKSLAAFNEAKTLMPGGVNSPVRSYANVDCNPPFIAKAKGDRIFDIDGNEYIGYLTIPALGLELPVMAELDSARLETAPCRYYGTPNDNLVIAGHNYSRHFGRLHDLRIEDPIMLTDTAGGKHLYRVCEIEILAGTAITQMLDSGYDLTLFTCTYGGRDRIAVRCESLSGK